MFGILLNYKSEIALKRQIYDEVKSRIINGSLAEGENLPSTRELAKQLSVSRNTVCEAYEMLLSEGFILSHQGSATKVAKGLNIVKTEPAAIVKPKIITDNPIIADFNTGQPDLRYFPKYIWNSILHKEIESMPVEQYGYTGPQGLLKLRMEISDWLFRSRGIKVDPEKIYITAGATYALHLISELLCNKDRGILTEDPCHLGMLRVLNNKDFPIYPVAVDEHGLITENLPVRNAAAVYVTPSHQFPLGGILPAYRRADLIRYARENNCYIIEDDYDSEFRYCGEPVAPIYSIDKEHVIYVGTFSKILFPALRIGYVILPNELHGKWKYLRTHTDVQNPPFEQAALAEYLGSRKLDRYVQRMRRVYGERRLVLINSLKQAFENEELRFWGDSAGLHLAVQFKGRTFDKDFINNCKRNGIRINTVEHHCISKGLHMDKLLIGYGHMEPDEIRVAVSVLHGYVSLM